MTTDEPHGDGLRLRRDVDPARDHVRGTWAEDAVVVVAYEDFLCPYCRRLRQVLRRLRDALGDRLAYVFRQFPNERAHPGAELAARASEAAARQGRFWDMHDRLFDREPPFERADLVAIARAVGLDVERFEGDLDSDDIQSQVQQDLDDGRSNGVTGTPTLFVDGIRYDGAWDFHSMLEAFERPVAARVHRSARVFASLPTSGGLVLLLTAVLALTCANTALAPIYEGAMGAHVGIGPIGHLLTLTVRDWLGEGLFSIFFLLVGLEIRREMTTGALTDRRAAVLPVLAAIGGMVTPALVYLGFNHGAAAHGWAIPTATDIAFTLALMAVLGARIPLSLRVFVAALAVVDDVLSVLTLAIFYPHGFAPRYAIAVAASWAALGAFNVARVYAIWPYVGMSLVLWLSLHALGVHAALAGVIVATCLPTRPAPAAVPLLAQAATALSALEYAEKEARQQGRDARDLAREPIWEWAARNLWAASERFSSPAERIERAVAPWSAYVILPVFAFSAAGVAITFDFSSAGSWRLFAGILIALIVGKPLGVVLASGLGLATGLAIAPEGVSIRQFVGAACLCGVADTVALLVADRALAPSEAAVAKLAVLIGSAIAGILGLLVLRLGAPNGTTARS